MTNEDISRAAEVIKLSAKDGVLPLEIFNSFSQVIVLSPVDLYAFIQHGENFEIVVAKRPADDEFLAGYWHIPGKIMITKDTSFEDTIHRVLETEIPGTKMLSSPVKFDDAYQSTLRGKEHVASFWAVVDKLFEPSTGEEIAAVPVNKLPEPFLKEQIERIQQAHLAAKDYIANKN